MANRERGYYTLKLGGQNRTLHFSMNFWANFTETLGISLENIGTIFQEGVSLVGLRALIYSGILAYDQEQGNQINYNVFTVGAWLEDLNSEEINNIVEAMLESRILGNDLNMGIKRSPIKPTNKTEDSGK